MLRIVGALRILMLVWILRTLGTTWLEALLAHFCRTWQTVGELFGSLDGGRRPLEALAEKTILRGPAKNEAAFKTEHEGWKGLSDISLEPHTWTSRSLTPMDSGVGLRA